MVMKREQWKSLPSKTVLIPWIRMDKNGYENKEDIKPIYPYNSICLIRWVGIILNLMVVKIQQISI